MKPNFEKFSKLNKKLYHLIYLVTILLIDKKTARLAEVILFGLPVITKKKGILEVSFKDESGDNLNDSVQIEIEFPNDLENKV